MTRHRWTLRAWRHSYAWAPPSTRGPRSAIAVGGSRTTRPQNGPAWQHRLPGRPPAITTGESPSRPQATSQTPPAPQKIALHVSWGHSRRRVSPHAQRRAHGGHIPRASRAPAGDSTKTDKHKPQTGGVLASTARSPAQRRPQTPRARLEPTSRGVGCTTATARQKSGHNEFTCCT